MIKRLLKYLYSNLYETNTKEDCLKAMNELMYNSIYDRDIELEKSLVQFYYDEFSTERKNTKVNEPVIYPNLLYEANYETIKRITENKGTLSKIIEHRVTSGVFLLGEMFYNKISEETYTWLWRNNYLIVENDTYVKNYWEGASMYFDYALNSLQNEYDAEFKIINSNEVQQRENERKRFLEFQYVFAGLIFYKKKYQSLNFLLTHTRSMPAEYSLLPKTIDSIFEMFKYFNQDFDSFNRAYYFPEVQWAKSEETIKKWVNYYIAILLLRQFVLNINDDYIPQITDYKIYEIRKMKEDIPLLEHSLRQIFKNTELQKELDFLYFEEQEMFQNRKEKIFNYLENFKNKISDSISSSIAKSELKAVKIEEFYRLAKVKFSEVYKQLNEFKNSSIYKSNLEDKKYYIKSFKEIVSKSPFIEGDIPNVNFSEAYTEAWSRGVLLIFVNSLTVIRTRSYLVKKDDFSKAISKLNVGTDFIIIGVNLGVDVEQSIQNYKCKFKSLKVEYSSISSALYILRESDLPFINYKELNPEEKCDFKLDKVINEEFKINSKVLDLNKEPDLIERLIIRNNTRTRDELLEAAVISVGVNTEIVWKKDAEVIQLSLQSQYTFERGVLNDIDDLIPFKKEKPQRE